MDDEDRTAAEATWYRTRETLVADGQLCECRAHRQPALCRRQGAGPAGQANAQRQGRARFHHRAGLRLRPRDRPQHHCRAEGRAGRPRSRQAHRQGAGHGQCHARVRPPAGGDQRLLRPVRRGVRRSRPACPLGGRPGLAAARHSGRDRGDRRGRGGAGPARRGHAPCHQEGGEKEKALSRHRLLPLLAALPAVVLVVQVHFTCGVVYSLDDPYIHLALARQILHGHYGINPGEFAAPSSSILWPFLLAPFAFTRLSEFLPLVINLGALVVAVWWFERWLETWLSPWWALVATAALAFALNLY